jgi:hypothetical protein
VPDFLHGLADRWVQLLGVDAAGLMLADQRGTLEMIASSSEQMRLAELFPLLNDQGPCLECYRSGAPVHEADLAGAGQRWPVRLSRGRGRVRSRAGTADAPHAFPLAVGWQV